MDDDSWYQDIVAAAEVPASNQDDFASFERQVAEARSEFLEDLPVADTVLAFERLAASRGLGVQLASSLLPS